MVWKNINMMLILLYILYNVYLLNKILFVDIWIMKKKNCFFEYKLSILYFNRLVIIILFVIGLLWKYINIC